MFIPLICPGFRIIWKTELSWQEGHRTIFSLLTLNRGHRQYQVQFNDLLRGKYEGESGLIILEDLFGFTRFVIFRGDPVVLHVLPSVNHNGFRREQIIRGGDIATADADFLRSDEFLEVRKYYPGDDARRINWKMFAASGQLFVRIGEEIPPPTGEITVILNSHSPSVEGLQWSSDYTDILINTYLTFVYAFIEKGCIVNTIIPGMEETSAFNQDKPDSLLQALSSVTPGTMLTPIHGNSFVYLISHPRSPFFNSLSELKEGEMKVFINKLPEYSRDNYFRQFLYKEIMNKTVSYRDLKEINSIDVETEKDLLVLKKIGKGKIYGEII